MTPEPMFTIGPGRWRAPVRRHRWPGASRRSAVLGALSALIVVIAAGGAVAGSQLSTDDKYRPFVVTGEFGEPVRARTFGLTAVAVRTAAAVTDQPGWRHDTGGVWVLARVRALAFQEVVTIGFAAVRDEHGRQWSATRRITQPLADAGHRLQPGVPVEAEIAFEVPREAATELTLQVTSAGVDQRMDVVVEVRLPVDESMIARGLAEPEPIMLAEPVVVIADPPVRSGAGVVGQP